MRAKTCTVAAVVLVGLSSVPCEAHAQPSARTAQLVTASTAQSQKQNRALKARCRLPTLICASGVLIRGAGHVGGAVIGTVGSAAGDALGAGASAVMRPVVSWAAEGAAWLLQQVSEQIGRSTRPALDSPWFESRYAGMAQLAIATVAVFLLLAVGQAIAAQDAGRLIRSALIALPSAMLLTFAAIGLVELALAVSDAMTAAALKGTGGDVRKAFHGIADVFTSSGAPTLAPFALFLSALVTSLLALIVWLELVMREAAVYVAVVFLPLTLAGAVWQHTSQWSRRLAEWLLAIVFAKFTIGVAFAIAASAIVNAPKGGGGLSALLAGCAVLAIAALTPWALFKLLPFAEAAAGRGFSRSNVSGAAGSVPGAATASMATRQLVMRNLTPSKAGAAAHGGAASPRSTDTATAPTPPRRPPDLPRANPPRRPQRTPEQRRGDD
jgi:hypothetical protein